MQSITYRSFTIPKRTGGTRKIEQPIDGGLEILQKKLEKLEKIEGLKPSYFSHAFMRGRNIVTCARQHFKKKFIARIDIHDFFGSIYLENFKDVVFPKEYYSKQKGKTVYNDMKNASRIMKQIEICFKERKIKSKETEQLVHYLPQGAPTSPLLSNAYMRNYDWEMAWFCYQNKIIYSRYADDIYLSTNKNDNKFWSCIKCCIASLKQLHLEENKKKRKVMKHGMTMNVVGICCDEKFRIPVKARKIIRAIKHNAKKNKTELTLEQKGLINFMDMVKKYKSKVQTNLEVCKGVEVINGI